MKIHDLHADPSKLKYSAEDLDEKVPKHAWEKHNGHAGEMKKREALWAKDAKYAFMYAHDYLGGDHFPAGERAIFSNPKYKYMYNIMTTGIVPGQVHGFLGVDPDYAESAPDVVGTIVVFTDKNAQVKYYDYLTEIYKNEDMSVYKREADNEAYLTAILDWREREDDFYNACFIYAPSLTACKKAVRDFVDNEELIDQIDPKKVHYEKV